MHGSIKMNIKKTKKQLEERLAFIEANPIYGFNGLNTFHNTEKSHVDDIKKCLNIIYHLELTKS